MNFLIALTAKIANDPTSGAYVPKSIKSVIVASHVANAVKSANPKEIDKDSKVPLKLFFGEIMCKN